ncbi:hypothetical protein ACFWAD_11165 [Rhodococcus sp. NPDC059969]|uniref:hypothetical protein n=1 Tax=Rhodococcus sp. NPDC059969 TaxID=3347018 RepID=UPI00366DD626
MREIRRARAGSSGLFGCAIDVIAIDVIAIDVVGIDVVGIDAVIHLKYPAQ